MKVLLFWSYYELYLECLYKKNPSLESKTYREQLRFILSDYFGWPPALVKRMEDGTTEVEILIVNARPLQEAWAKENGYQINEKNWKHDIPLHQVEQFQPDIIWIGSMFDYFGDYVKQLKMHCHKIFAWIAIQSPSGLNLSGIDCVLTSHTNFQQYFLDQGKACEILLPAFEPKILDRLQQVDRDIDCSFVGSLSYMHLQRMEIIQKLVDLTPIEIWSNLPKLLSKGLFSPKFIQNYLKMSNVRQRLHESVWGMEMYNILAKSKTAINVHVDSASGLAGNIRMFEATGMGSLLITENSPNIKDLYEPGVEIAIYNNYLDLADKINYYLENPEELALIAAAGQNKTLKTHSTITRSEELKAIFYRFLTL